MATAKTADVGLRGALALALAGVLVLLTGCAGEPATEARQDRPPRTLEPVFDGVPALPPADMSGDGPGTLVDAQPLQFMESFDQISAAAVKMTYRSTSGLDDRPTEVSGVVVVPAGPPPRGGWPVLAVGHILTGIIPQCAPSLAAELGGYASILSVFVSKGYVVAMSDYEGLGVDGLQHLPLQAATLGNNLIDSVRAARRIVPTASNRWAAYGIGEGGLASWAAADLASTYGAGTQMVGAVALSPYANMSGMAEAAAAERLPREQYYLYLSVLQSLSNAPPQFDTGEYTTPFARESVDVTGKCAPLDVGSLADAAAPLSPADIRPRNEAAVERFRDQIGSAAVPLASSGPAAPVLVVYATEDPSVSAQSIADAARTACQRGNPVEVNRRVGDANTSNDLVTQLSIGWLEQRFDGQALVDPCVGVT